MRLHFVLSIVALGLTIVVLGIAAASRGLGWSDLPDLLAFALPAVWIGAVGWLSRTDRTHARHATTCAAMVVLMVAGTAFWSLTSPLWIGKQSDLPRWLSDCLGKSEYLTGPAVLTALVPAAAGWWQRRRDRFAAEDGDFAPPERTG